MTDFKKIRTRIFLSNLLAFAIVITGFAGAVRFVFVRNLRQQLTERLTALGQGAAAGAELEEGELDLEAEFQERELLERRQALQVFDLRGHLLEQQGEDTTTLPFDSELTVQIQSQAPPVQAVTLPIFDSDNRQLIGYLRVSQSLKQFERTIRQLDYGFGFGALVALLLGCTGSTWLNRQVMQPIEESIKRLKQFTADASHELRSPLMVISTNTEVALTYPQGMRTSDEEKFQAIASATNQMSQLTEDLLLLARTDNIADFERKRLDLSVLLADLVHLYRVQARAKQIELKTEIASNLELIGDEAKLTRVFTNLIQNALQYTLEGGNIEIFANRHGRELRVTVTDTGIGIEREYLDKIFERLWRGDRSRSYVRAGSGLGLAIARAIVQNHGGVITVTSQIGVGSCFQVCLPATHTSVNST
ncbi:cell wall metabolism sensor histidine kinase WalK [Myxosarcina sp. GI1]|uniref:sensor histidine kinase n=1 Tax=Myxosarcina sp. GI1 TaxID=1541065 RepID=UPI00209EF70D|nr:ATP-binding protein [Myxosarcina sp. GI1]